MNDLFGFSRAVVKSRYALLTPDGFGPANVPGWKHAVVHVTISPALGARFTQLLVTLAADGSGEGNTGANEYFLHVLEGSGTITLPDRRHRLETGSHVYLPPGTDMQVKSAVANLRLVIFQKQYEALAGTGKAAAFVGHEREVKGQPFRGHDGVHLQALLPDKPEFDLAVNLFTCQPGAPLAGVATHVMEHGMMLLGGQGIFRLDNDWHPVRAGDVIWVAPYCPQWFVALGKAPARYLCYQDVNRDPM